MRAAVGDKIVLRGKKVGDVDRHGVITGVKGQDGQPPFSVKWDDGREAVVFPGGDFSIEHATPQQG